MGNSMFFDGSDMHDKDSVHAEVVLKRIEKVIKDELVYEPDYSTTQCIDIERAEELLLGVRQLIKDIKK